MTTPTPLAADPQSARVAGASGEEPPASPDATSRRPVGRLGLIDMGAFDGSRDGRSCPVDYHAEILPLHRFDLPNAPVTAWKVRVLGGGLHPGEHVEWFGPRRERREDAARDLAALTGAAA